MTAERVLGLVGALEGLEVWVDGGWGVDALVGRQTRVHGDLDLGVVRDELERVVGVLNRLGYEVTDARYPDVTLQLTHVVEGHRVDLHPSTAVDGGTEQVDFDGDVRVIPPAVEGWIGGVKVRCMPVEAQRRARQGYVLRAQDHHDLRLLDALEQD
ncbi:hypothetical protein PWY87_34920 [Kribbella solani]|uniref:nucleotidyltransferase domain-containing protein n=2 Tax=Kribbella solani TaxID=236067 RepID=UPI0029A5F4ED|nr:hypothetical protein [Kribbella solani]MDX3006911.1 hypothetical protein [Kribbella solani]